MSSCASEPPSPCGLVSDAACACPAGYTRYGTRCLQLLAELQSSWFMAQSECRARGGGLAVPRSGPEQDQINSAAAGASTKIWIGVMQDYAGQVFGQDDCGVMTEYFWAGGERAYTGLGAVSHSPPALAGNTGWYAHEGWTGGPYHPLCQLTACYRSDCSA